jgi:hypothetical protein
MTDTGTSSGTPTWSPTGSPVAPSPETPPRPPPPPPGPPTWTAPPPPPPPLGTMIWGNPPPPPPQPQRRRTRLWIGLAVGVVVAVLAAGGVVFLVGMNTVLTHDLLKADFAQTAAPFHVGSADGADYRLVDGTYAIRQTDTGQHVNVSVGEYTRVAYAVDTTTDVSVPSDQPAPIAVGLGCYNNNSANASPDGYVLLANPDGSGAVIQRRNAGLAGPVLATYTAPPGTAQPVTNLRLTCGVDSPVGNGMHMTGWINGTQVLTANDANGINNFAWTALVLSASQPGTEARFDNAVATVPGG